MHATALTYQFQREREREVSPHKKVMVNVSNSYSYHIFLSYNFHVTEQIWGLGVIVLYLCAVRGNNVRKVENHWTI